MWEGSEEGFEPLWQDLVELLPVGEAHEAADDLLAEGPLRVHGGVRDHPGPFVPWPLEVKVAQVVRQPCDKTGSELRVHQADAGEELPDASGERPGELEADEAMRTRSGKGQAMRYV